MKVSEMIKVLQEQMALKGDVKVVLYGAYGFEGDEFWVATDDHLSKEHRKEIWIYTGINTG